MTTVEPNARSRMSLTSQDVVWAGVGAAATAVGGFAFAWVTARTLGPEGSGLVLSYSTWFLAMIVLGKVGMDTTLVWATARACSGAEPAQPRTLLRWALVPAAAVSGLIGLAMWVGADVVGPWALAAPAGSDLVQLVRVGALLLPLAVLTLLLLSQLRGLGDPKPLLVIDQVIKPASRVLAAILTALFIGATAQRMVWAWLASIPLCLLLTLLATRAHGKPSGGDPNAGRIALAESRQQVYRFAAPRTVAQILDTVSASVGTLLLAVIATATDTGLFGTALRLALAGQLAFAAMRLLVAPILAFDLSRGRVDAAQKVYSSSTVLIVSISWPLYLIMMGCPGLVLSVFGTEFSAAAAMLVILALGSMVQAALGNLQAAVLMSGGSGRALAATAAAMVVNVGATVALYSAVGGTAAAIGWALGVLTEAGILWVLVRRLGLHPGPASVRRMSVIAVLTVLPAALAFGWATRQGDHLLAVTAAVCGAGAYTLLARRPIRRAWSDLTRGRSEIKGGVT